jgi:hypothetical protein
MKIDCTCTSSIQAYGEITFHEILTRALDRGEWPPSNSTHFTRTEKKHSTRGHRKPDMKWRYGKYETLSGNRTSAIQPVTVQNNVFWDRYRRFGGPSLHFQRRYYFTLEEAPPKQRKWSSRLYGDTSQMTVMFSHCSENLPLLFTILSDLYWDILKWYQLN